MFSFGLAGPFQQARASHSFSVIMVPTLTTPSILLDATPRAAASWRRYIAPTIAIALLAAAVLQLGTINLRQTIRLLPAAPQFWLVYAGFYLTGPAADWIIFRRLWRLPAAGFVALLRKTISNEVLLGYSGEVYFYGWAKRHGRLAGAPFGAIKDVAILSAAAGNVATLLLLATCWPVLARLGLGLGVEMLGGSIAVVALCSLIPLAFGRTLFSLRRDQLVEVIALHAARITIGTVLIAALWHEIAPAAPLHWWVALAALRLLVSRLPFVPNKDVIFAGIAVAVIGRQALVSDVLTLVAGLVMATHLLLGASLAIAELAGLDVLSIGRDEKAAR